LRSYLDADEAQSPYRQQERLMKERLELTEAVMANFKKDFRGRFVTGPLFRWILGQAQVHTRERDTMHFEWTRLFAPTRRLLLELGRRWQKRGLLEQQDDIFFLRYQELEETAVSPTVREELVRARREEFEASSSRLWPEIIRDGREIYLDTVEYSSIAEGDLQGVAGSPGIVTGISRVISGPEEFYKLRKGEILIAPLTNPVWTPLFAVAGGLITEVGGILSHGAIVAREYGLPAVMAVPGATKQIQDGQTITVDGNKGIVHVGTEIAA
jgi:pyruvate,water dikinase